MDALVGSDSFVTPCTAARQAPLSMGFSRQEYWSGLPFPPPGDLPNPGIELTSLMSLALAGGFFTPSTPPGKPLSAVRRSLISCPVDCLNEDLSEYCYGLIQSLS